jgi:hypothetical protein
MSDILVRIKRAVLAGHYAFSHKALLEMECEGITEMDVAESILNAPAIYKKEPSAPSAGVSLRDSKRRPGRLGDILER